MLVVYLRYSFKCLERQLSFHQPLLFDLRVGNTRLGLIDLLYAPEYLMQPVRCHQVLFTQYPLAYSLSFHKAVFPIFAQSRRDVVLGKRIHAEPTPRLPNRSHNIAARISQPGLA